MRNTDFITFIAGIEIYFQKNHSGCYLLIKKHLDTLKATVSNLQIFVNVSQQWSKMYILKVMDLLGLLNIVTLFLWHEVILL